MIYLKLKTNNIVATWLQMVTNITLLVKLGYNWIVNVFFVIIVKTDVERFHFGQFWLQLTFILTVIHITIMITVKFDCTQDSSIYLSLLQNKNLAYSNIF